MANNPNIILNISASPGANIEMSVNGSNNRSINTEVKPGVSVRMPVDATLNITGAAADARATGNRIRALESAMPGKVNRPEAVPNGTEGQFLRTNGDGTTVWETIGVPTAAQVQAVMEAWLEDHPEATTTVQDGSITYLKLANALQTILDKSVDGAYVEDGSLYLTHNGEVVAGPFSGFGGGGSGGGSGGSTNSAVMTLENASGWAVRSFSKGTSANITISWSSIEDGYETGNGRMIVKVNGLEKDTRNVEQGVVTVDVGEYCEVGANTVQILVYDSYGNSRVKNFTINIVELTINSSFDESVVRSGAISFPYTVVGEVRKTIYFLVDGNPAGTKSTAESGAMTQQIAAQTHGAHTIDVYFTATVNGQVIPSNTLHYDVIWALSGNSTPVIASSYNTTTIDQYATINIPYRVYTPDSQVSSVTIAVDGETVATLPSVDRSVQNFNYRMNEDGNHAVTITTGGVTKRFSLTVNPVTINARATTDNMALYLTSSGRSNNEANPAIWGYGSGNDRINATLTGFNWASDGWQTDDDGITMLRVAGNARVTIPYKIFEDDFRQEGKTIEIEFAARNVLDYDTPILSCMDDGRGFQMTAQYAVLKSEQSELSMQYKEDDHIRLTFVVEKQSANRLMMVYVNAIPSGVIQYAAQDDFSQMTPKNITIGSNDCAIDIYNIRIYDTDLTKKQVMDNWIADTQSGSVMVDRFGRNNLYDEYGNIVINKLPSNLPYMILECPQLPQYKGDKKTITGSYTDPTNPANSFTFEGCQINVQGTSSAPYARKNYDMQFKQGFIMSSGATENNYALRPTVVPFNRFVMKADVASSEGANNVELVRLYCETTPYKTREMLANSKVRQGIDGFPIVIFWRNTDTGKTSFLGKYNFNLPKRAPGPYGYSGEMESWEFQNNTSNLMLFKTNYFDETLKYDEDADVWKETWRFDYEARFPSDEWVNYTKLQELESFIFSTYRANATGNALAEPVTYQTRVIEYVEVTDPSTGETHYEETYVNRDVTFTTDSADYRLLKFRTEFGNYAEVNSFIFYYIFTELFLMVDSRAKNLFIGFSGSDTDPNKVQHIDRKAVAEPYDMDTALGINNEGSLVFGYNLEDTDTTAGGANVFNGQDSVLWNNLRDAFPTEIAQMYKQLRSGGVFNYNAIENRFESHQEKWPEAIWIEDSWFKYIDPLINPDPGKEPTDVYLPMLQGSKLEQRRWWLNNRFKYMDSKWNAGDAVSNVIQIRAYAKANITVTPYADIYAAIKYASYMVKQRATHNTPVTLVCPVDTLNDSEVYIYSAPQIASVGDLSPLKVGWADFSKATKLQSLKLGDNTVGYTNNNLNFLSLGTNPLIQTVDVRNCTALGTGDQKSVDLSGCASIENVYFDGTALLGVDLPNGGVLKRLHLPDTVTNLTIRNQTALTEFVFGAENPPDYSSITTLWLENPASCIDTEAIVEGMPENGRVRLFNFHWEVESLTDVDALFDKLDTMRGLDQNGNNTQRAQVYGTIYVENAEGSEYSTITQRYPDVTITYEHITSHLKYYNEDGSVLLHTEDVMDSADGTWNGTDSKESTAQYTYAFAGWSTEPGGAADPNATKTVTGDRNVYAAFTETVRTYTVSFVRNSADGGGTLQSGQVAYGTVPEYTGNTPESEKSDGGLYVFNGWTPAVAAVTGDATYTATFVDSRPVLTYMNGDTVVKTERLIPGGDGTGVSTTPTKESSVSTVYTFAGWSRNSSATEADPVALANVNADRTVYAVYTESVRQYRISFVKPSEHGGGTMQTGMVDYGTVPVYSGTTPASTRTDGIWEFRGWSPAIAEVTGEQTYTATYEDVSVKVTYKNGTTTLRTEVLAVGSNGTGVSTTPTKETTAQYTFTFAGWSLNSDATEADPNALVNVTQNRTVYAIFTATVRTYTITFVKASEDGGGTLQTKSVAYGTVPEYTGSTPTSTRQDYVFRGGWTPTIAAVTGDATYTAVFVENVSKLDKYLKRTLTTYETTTATKVGQYAFDSMTTLTSVETSATEIGTYAFNECTNLENVDLTATSGAVSIAASAFAGCTKLNALIIRSSTMATLANENVLPAYNFTNGDGAIYVPGELLSSYKAASGWSTYSGRIYPISAYPVTNFDTIADDWATIKSYVNAGTAGDHYAVGDTKSVDLGNLGKIRFEVIAKDADTLKTGGNAQLTMFAKMSLSSGHRMNPQLSGTTEGTGAIGGWEKCEMRTYLNETILPLLPADLQDMIKEVVKYTRIYDTTGTAVNNVQTYDKLWIPSYYEIFAGSSYETSGVTYSSHFPTAADRIRYMGTSVKYWWLRSASASGHFYDVGSTGIGGTNTAYNAGGVAFGFCI